MPKAAGRRSRAAHLLYVTIRISPSRRQNRASGRNRALRRDSALISYEKQNSTITSRAKIEVQQYLVGVQQALKPSRAMLQRGIFGVTAFGRAEKRKAAARQICPKALKPSPRVACCL